MVEEKFVVYMFKSTYHPPDQSMAMEQKEQRVGEMPDEVHDRDLP